MTDSNYTDITMLLDRSGSMAQIKSDIDGGFDVFIEEQKKLPGVCKVTLIQFDDQYDVVFQESDVNDVPRLDLQPRGMTALLDAIGKSINQTGERLAAMAEEQRPGTVIFGIITDGYENASREYTKDTIKSMIEKQENVYSWRFTFLAANQDAIQEGAKIGIKADSSMTYSTDRVDSTFLAYSRSVGARRGGAMKKMSIDDIDKEAAFSDEERESAISSQPDD